MSLSQTHIRGAHSYSHFYWPLALASLVLILESQFQNAVLARYADPFMQLATFALAASSFHLLNAVLVFVPQMVTIMARCPRSRRTCLRFAAAVGLLLSAGLLAVGYIGPATRLFATVMRIPPELLSAVIGYLRWLAPLLFFNALRQYYLGILVRNGRTRLVTMLNVMHLAVLIGMLSAGLAGGWPPLVNLAAATVSANLLHFALILSAAAGKTAADEASGSRPPRYREIMAFFLPVAVTSVMFAMCRPLMYAFVNRTEAAIVTLAALRLAFDATTFFQQPCNQFRHLYTAFGDGDPAGVRRFMLRVGFVFTAAMAALAFLPVGGWLFRTVLGVDGDVLVRTLQALRVLCLAPLTVTVRNLFHGRLMVMRRTGGMAAGAILRVVAIGLLCWATFRTGLFGHVACAWMLVGGFAIEAGVARLAVMRARGCFRRGPDRCRR